MEIAVSAFRLAERDLYVDSEIHGAKTDFSTAVEAVQSGLIGISHDFDVHRSFARAIVFAEENTLPAAQNKAAQLDENLLACSGENCLSVRVGVALGVAVRAAVWDEAIQDAFEIGSDVGVGVFVDGDARRSVGNVDVANTLLDSRFGYKALNFVGHVNELRTPIRADAQGFDFCHNAEIVARAGSHKIMESEQESAY
jgi:hypothetical protein